MDNKFTCNPKFYNILKVSLFLGTILRGILLYMTWEQLMHLPVQTLIVIVMFIAISPSIFSICMIYSLFNFTIIINPITQYILASYIVAEIMWISWSLFFKIDILDIDNHKGRF